MFAVAVERSPLDLSRTILFLGGPVEGDVLTGCAGVADRKLTSLVHRRKTDDKAADLIFAPGGVNVRLEFAIRRAVDVDLVKLSL